MFGYLRIDRNEIKHKHYLEYRKYYCYVCNSLMNNLGRKWCLLTSYDVTFFLLLFDSIESNRKEITLNCPLNPFDKNRTIMISDNEERYIAFIVLLYYYLKLKDNALDEHKKKYIRKQQRIENSPKCTALFNSYPEAFSSIISITNQYYEKEQENNLSFDDYADLMGNLFGEVFRGYLKISCSEIEENTFKKIGSELGKWIYLIDAFDDLEQDVKNQNFNPILHMQDYEQLKFNELCKKVSFISQCIAQNIYYNLKTLPTINHREIIYNVIKYGMNNVIQNLIEKKRKERNESI